MRISKILIVVGIIFLVSFSGCASSRRTQTAASMGLELSALLKFDDVPIPHGFKFLPKESFAFQNDIFRVAMLRYAGKGTGEQVVSFYKEQMSLFGWGLQNIVEYGIKTLNFERPDETCTIVIESRGSRSKISVSVAPKARSRAPKVAAPARIRIKQEESSLK